MARTSTVVYSLYFASQSVSPAGPSRLLSEGAKKNAHCRLARQQHGCHDDAPRRDGGSS